MSLGEGIRRNIQRLRNGRRIGKRAVPQSPRFVRLCLDPLESRLLLSTNVLVNDPTVDGTANVQSETALVLGSGSNVVAAFNDSGAGTGHFTGFANSTNAGVSFRDAGSLPVSSFGDAGDPVLARDTLSGTVYLSTLGFAQQNTIPVFRSFDNGVSFAAPVNGATGFSSAFVLDKEWITVDNSAAPGAGRGNVYLVFTKFMNGADLGLYFARSTDGGSSWTTPFQLTSSGQGAYVTTGPDHALYVFYQDVGITTEAIRMLKSTDQGTTFPLIVTVTNLATTGSNGDLGLTVSSTNPAAFRTNAYPQAVVTSTGIFVTFDDKGVASGDKADVYFTESTDGGTSWAPRTKVNDDTTTLDQWQPAIAATPDGSQLGIFWYDRRLDPADGSITRMGVTGSIAAGVVSFRSNFTVSNTSFPALPGGVNVNPTYMGDYDQVVADNTFFYTTWGDNRTPSQGPDVRFAKVDFSPPTAGRSYAYSLAPNTSFFVPSALLQGVTDPGSDPIIALLGTQASHGTVTVNADGSFTYVPTPSSPGPPPIPAYTGFDSFTYVAHDKDGNSAAATVDLYVFSAASIHMVVAGFDVTVGIVRAEVKVFDATHPDPVGLPLRYDFLPFEPNFTGGARVALGDVLKDGIPDIIVGRGASSAFQSDVRVYPGDSPNLDPSGAILPMHQGDFLPYSDTGFSGGIFVAAGRLNGVYSSIVTGPDIGGGPNVRAWDDTAGSNGPAKTLDFFAYNTSFTGGVRVAAADFDGNGKADIITGAGPGGGPNVRVFDGLTAVQFVDFQAYGLSVTTGVYVAAGDTNGDGKADIIAGPGGGPMIGSDLRVWAGFARPNPLPNPLPAPALLNEVASVYNPSFTGGVRVAYIGDINNPADGKGDILTGPGPTGGPNVLAIDGVSLGIIDSFFAFAQNTTYGIFIGGN